MRVGCGRFDGKYRRVALALVARKGLMTASTSKYHYRRQVTRRSVCAGATASLICAPAILQVTNLMPVHSLILRPKPQHVSLAKRLFYHSLWCSLRSGRADTRMSQNEARLMVAYAQAQGWLHISSVNAVEEK